MMGRDEVGLDRQFQYAKSLVEVVLPDRCVPFRRAAFQDFAAPDIVDEHVDVAVILADLAGPIALRPHDRGGRVQQQRRSHRGG